MLEDPISSSFSCTPPPPQNITYFNPSTNQSLSFEKEIEVHEIGILFNYEIRHESGVTWGDVDGESSGSIREWADKAGDFFSNLFGGDDEDIAEEEGSSESEDGDNGAAELIELENYMASEIWANALDNEEMTWNENECMGLLIEEVKINLNKPLVLEDEEEEEVLDTPDVSDAETKLLGLMHQPIDYVSSNGCTIPDPTCTAVRGQVSVAYSGANEYGVVQTVIEKLREAMEAGTFIPSGSPALNLEFQSAVGTTLTGGNTGIIPINTVRGTEQPQEEEENSGDLSQYGTLFVCLVAILGAGFIASTVVRYRKRQRRVNQMDESEDHEANLTMQEQDAGKTDAEGDSSKTDSPGAMNQVGTDSPGVTNQVDLELPPADSNEVELSWSGNKVF